MYLRPPGSKAVQKPAHSARLIWAHPLARGLVGSWLMNGHGPLAAGSAAQSLVWDGAANNHGLVDYLGAYWGPGPRGAILRFNGGADSSVLVARNPAFKLGTSYSIVCRARCPSTGFKWLISRVGGSWLGISNGNKLVWTVTAGTDKLGSANINDGLWHTLGVTLDGGTLKLWIDGSVDATFASVTNSITDTNLYFGHRGDFNEPFDGDMEFVHQWNRALDPQEMRALHEDPFGFYQPVGLNRYILLTDIRNPNATGARVTQVAAEIAYPTNPVLTAARVTQELVEVGYPADPIEALTRLGPTGTQALRYIATGGQGTREWHRYQSYLGTSQAESQTYNLVNDLRNAVIVTDADGLPPSGNATYDQTPTISFVATGAVGSGPFLYTWWVTAGASGTASGTVVLSGAVIADTQITLPHLDPAADYRLTVTAVNAAGGLTQITPLVFTILARRPPPQRPFTELPSFDLEPVAPLAPEYLRYLPRWMSVHGTATALPSAALLFQTLAPILQAQHTAAEASQSLADQTALSQVPTDLPRLAWRLQSRLTAADAPTLSVRASGDIREIRRAGSEYDFFTADDPVYLLGNSGQLLFRNLALREVTAGAVAASGAGAAQYQMPAEGNGIVPDARVLFTQGSDWYRIRGGSTAIDPDRALVQLSPALSGSHTFRYQSESYLPLVQVAVSGQPWSTPGSLDLWNRFDEIGLLAGLSRRPGEDNLAFRRRLESRLLIPPGNRAEDVQQAIAADLALTEVIGWDGLARLDLAASGFTGVRGVLVPGLPALGSWQGELFPDGDRQFWAAKRDWLPGWQVTVDGRPVTHVSYPTLTQSGFLLDFGQSVSGRVEAQLQFRPYLTETTDGFVTGLVPCSGNMVSGAYQVLLAQNVRLFVPTDPAYQAATLLNADGTPNQFFLALKERLLAGSPLHLTRARWGSAFWFDADTPAPPLSHLPIPLDRFADSGGLVR